MKVLPLKYFCTTILIILLFFVVFSCKKSADSQEKNIFTWTHNGITNTTSIDTAYINNQSLAFLPHTIMAGYPRLTYFISKRVEFNLTSFNTGTYTFSAAAGSVNKLSFVDEAGNDLIGTSGTLTITVNANNKISGNFSATVLNASSATSQLTGSFTHMQVVP